MRCVLKGSNSAGEVGVAVYSACTCASKHDPSISAMDLTVNGSAKKYTCENNCTAVKGQFDSGIAFKDIYRS